MKIIPVPCFIQEGSLGSRKIKQLEASISVLYKKHFGRKHVVVFAWLSIPFGQSYLGGNFSNASTVQIPVEDNLPSEKRHSFMREVCTAWQDVTGCSKNEIILVSSDRSDFKKTQAAMMSRFAQSSSRKAKLKMLAGLVRGFISRGYLNSSVNL
nr:hypothetical protein [Pseudomonas benzenivorans]